MSPTPHPQQHFVQCLSPAGLHRMAYWQWGEADNPDVVVCVHGLSRVGRDFDALAARLAKRFRVICPDVVGRGASDYLRDPQHYQVPQYVADMVSLIARLDVPKLRWVGTSMGGLIGMGLAAIPNSPITQLVMNDVGPILKADALKRIGEYVGQAPRFANLAAAEAYIRAVSAPFALKNDAQWRMLTEISLKPDGDGFQMHYDPAIAVPFKAQNTGSADIALWHLYEAMRCKVLVTRGALSDLLAPDTVALMAAGGPAGQGPKAQTREVANVGHAPMFFDDDQIDLIDSFL